MSTNSEKTHLRIRIRSNRDEGDNENDGSKSNNTDIRLRIRYIARVGSDKGASDLENGGRHKKDSFFVIKMKQPVGEWSKFKFVSESLAERDTVVLAIRSLMDQAKQQFEVDRRSESRNDRYESRESRESSRRAEKRTVFEDQNRDESRSSHVERSYGKERANSSTTALVDTTSLVGRKSSSHHRRSALSSYRQASADEVIGCNPMSCQSQALAAVEDGDLANLVAGQLSGPWCTDDVCTAGLTGFADSMKGIFDGEGSPEGMYAAAQKHAEKHITEFLGDQTPVSEMLSVKDIFNVTPIPEEVLNRRKIKTIHNRARNTDGKALHLKNLKAQMTFQGANASKKMSFLQITNSFDDVNRSAKRERKPNSKTLLIAGQKDSSAFLDLDVNQVVDLDEERFYYDSDPEGARERTLKRGPRRATAERENLLDGSGKTRKEALNILGTSRFGLGRKWRRHGEEVVLDIIEATKNEKFTLMWHPTQTKSDTDDLPTVVCVKMWVEAGVYLVDGTFLLPKLTWLPVHEQNLHARVLNTNGDSPGSLDLLDVCRVKECETIDRNQYPFAHVDRSFIIQTQAGKQLFEAQSKQERGRVVNGLKLVIARLASLLMLRDVRAVDEFFCGNNSVPGEAPEWARSERNTSGNELPSRP